MKISVVIQRCLLKSLKRFNKIVQPSIHPPYSFTHSYSSREIKFKFTTMTICFSISNETLYHCLSKSAMYKQKKSLLQITLLEQPQPIKCKPPSIIFYFPWKFTFVTLNFCLQISRSAKGF